MTLAFPNSTRSYDAKNGCVRFIGYDGMFQIFFSVAVDAVSEKRFEANQEENYLKAFDKSRTAIQTVAAKLYGRTRSNMYSITAADFS